MNFDLRIPMGWMFTLTGLLLSFFGWSTNENAALYARSLGINVNLWWGLALLVFGLTMMVFGKRGQKATENREKGTGKRRAARRS